MKKILLFSILLIIGLGLSQYAGMLGAWQAWFNESVQALTMLCLSFIMIHVGYEFNIDRKNLKKYAIDYGVAATAAAFPWIFCAVYFVFIMSAPDQWWNWDTWKETLLAGRFAAPTSAGILFSMLAAAGLSSTWYFRKIRILAIFDDLDTVLFMIPLKMMIVGMRWQLGVIILVMVVMLWLAWRYLHQLRWPVTWKWVLGYSAIITIVSEIIYYYTKLLDDVVPVHIEVLLPAFVLGCMLAHVTSDSSGEPIDVLEQPQEQKASMYISCAFMLLVGLSMPPIRDLLAGSDMSMKWLALHVLAITVVSNLGKMFPLFCYRKEADWKTRLGPLCGYVAARRGRRRGFDYFTQLWNRRTYCGGCCPFISP